MPERSLARRASAAAIPALAAGATLPALAAGLDVHVEIPRLNVTEYHRPYVAVWIEKPDQSFVSNLSVWYAVNHKDKEGPKWLKDMRAWWRKSGRELSFPVDGLTGATRAPGEHVLAFTDAAQPVKNLAPGNYEVVVEAAREVGGRELLRVPFAWPPKSAATARAKGQNELGTVSVEVKP